MTEHFHYNCGQLLRLVQHRESTAAKDAACIARRLAVDGQAEDGDSLAPRLGHGLTRIFDAVAAFIDIDVVRLPVREQKEETRRCRSRQSAAVT